MQARPSSIASTVRCFLVTPSRARTIEEVMRKIWPFYGVMFAVLMLVTYLPTISLWLPHLLGL